MNVAVSAFCEGTVRWPSTCRGEVALTCSSEVGDVRVNCTFVRKLIPLVIDLSPAIGPPNHQRNFWLPPVPFGTGRSDFPRLLICAMGVDTPRTLQVTRSWRNW